MKALLKVRQGLVLSKLRMFSKRDYDAGGNFELGNSTYVDKHGHEMTDTDIAHSYS
jgi:hypothetical protein